MAELTITKTWATDDTLTAADLNNSFGEVETFVSGANLQASNLADKYSTVAYTMLIDVNTLVAGAGATHNFKFKAPVGTSTYGDLTPNSLSLHGSLETGKVTLDLRDSGSKLSSVLEIDATGGSPVSDILDSTTSFTGGNIVAGSTITFQVITTATFLKRDVEAEEFLTINATFKTLMRP